MDTAERMKSIQPSQITTKHAPNSKSAILGFVILVVYLAVACQVITQVLAHRFDNQPALGVAGAMGLYPPLAWVGWAWKFYRSAPQIFGWAGFSFAIAAGVGFFTYALFVGFVTRAMKQYDGVHGTAHWATEAEIRASGLLPAPGKAGAGVYVGAWRDSKDRLHYLRHDGPEHVAAIAPTRSGKGVGLVVPTLLSWPHSVVVNDQKGELWAMTAGWRKTRAGSKVLKFDPASEHGSVAFNPLDEIRVETAHEVGDVQNLVTIIVDPEGKGMSDHWSKTAHAFLTGVVLHLQYIARQQGGSASLPGVAAALSDPSAPISALYDAMLNNQHIVERDKAGKIVGRRTHPTVAAAGRDMLNRAEAERSSVLSTAMSYLALYRDPLVAKNVSRSDFQLSDLMNHAVVTEHVDAVTGEITETRTPVPVSLYLVVRAEDKDRMRPLMRLVMNQIVRVLLRPELKYVEGREQPPHLTRLLMMIDEFPSYGKLDVIQEALAYIAGYGIKAYLIMQDIAQLQSIYGRDESILSNCHIRVAYAPNKIETGEWLSKNTGQATVMTERITTSGSRFGALLQQTSRSFQEGSRALLTADEAMRLGAAEKDEKGNITKAGEVLAFAAGHPPIRGEQSLYFVNPVFAERVKIPPPATSDRIERQAPAPEPGGPTPEAAQAGFGAFLAGTLSKAEPPKPQRRRPARSPSGEATARTKQAQVHAELRGQFGSPDPEQLIIQEAMEAEPEFDPGHPAFADIPDDDLSAAPWDEVGQ